jgi:anhydro-N-acetylmuramic acid kinase
MGGISNFTFLPADLNAGSLFSTDVGPGNTLIDQYVQKYFGLAFDKNAEIASSGAVNRALLDELLTCSFLALPFPKTTGPELFNLTFLENAQKSTSNLDMKHEDVLATLCMFTSQVITHAINNVISLTQLSIYTSGGGMHNPLMMKNLKELLPAVQFFSTTDLNINPDAKEAVLFALLANECVAGGNSIFEISEQLPAVCMGKISMPK